MSEVGILGIGAGIVSAILLIPYFGWGIHTLRIRFRYHEDLPPVVEALTLLAVAAFYAVETMLLRAYLAQHHIYFMFAVLGLTVSGASLYGPMIISLFSQLLVDFMAPAERSKTREPRYAPAEALEREEDYEGALREYMVIARIFPREPTVFIRIADLYVRLSQAEEAVPWFERALGCLDSPEESLRITNRLFEIQLRRLGRPEEAARLLETYLQKFPDAEYASSVRDRLVKLRALRDPQPVASENTLG